VRVARAFPFILVTSAYTCRAPCVSCRSERIRFRTTGQIVHASRAASNSPHSRSRGLRRTELGCMNIWGSLRPVCDSTRSTLTRESGELDHQNLNSRPT